MEERDRLSSAGSRTSGQSDDGFWDCRLQSKRKCHELRPERVGSGPRGRIFIDVRDQNLLRRTIVQRSSAQADKIAPLDEEASHMSTSSLLLDSKYYTFVLKS